MNFSNIKNERLLEIGVGLGADHEILAKTGCELYGIDLTDRAIEKTKKRFKYLNLKSNLTVADAENLPFDDNYFSKIYSWGVLHHS